MKRFWTAIGLSLSLFVGGCGAETQTPVKDTRLLLDTAIEITAYGKDAKKGIAAAFDEYERIQKIADRFQPDSDISRVNAAAGGAPVKVDPLLIDMVAAVEAQPQPVRALVKMTIGPVADVWQIKDTADWRPPAETAVQAALAFMDEEALEVDRQASTLRLAKTGMSLDVGAVAKGYATDRAVAALRAAGVKHALINAGGNVHAVGAKPDGSPWRVGLQHPREKSKLSGVFALADGESLQTSGDYQRFVIYEGKRYAHIFDPRTGAPSDTGLSSATIVCKSSTLGDILSTAVYVAGLTAGQNLLQQYYPDSGSVLIPIDGQTISSDNIKERFSRQ